MMSQIKNLGFIQNCVCSFLAMIQLKDFHIVPQYKFDKKHQIGQLRGFRKRCLRQKGSENSAYKGHEPPFPFPSVHAHAIVVPLYLKSLTAYEVCFQSSFP